MRSESANLAMGPLLGEAKAVSPTSLDSGLATYLSDGLVVESDGSIVAAAARHAAYAERSRFTDRVEYEAFVNKAHLDDWSSESLASATLGEKLAQALLLADRVGAWGLSHGFGVAVIISADAVTRDLVFRFHGLRLGDASWCGDIHEFLQPVLIITYDRYAT